MEFSQEQYTEMGLSEESIPKFQDIVNSQEAELKKQWDSKANENAEKILDGVSTSLATKYGLTEQRQQGEKLADYIGRVSPMVVDTALAKEKQAMASKLSELDEKLKKAPTGALQGEFDELKSKYNALQEKEAKFAEWEENDYKGKWEEATQKLSQQTRDIAFSGVRPSFPDNVNSYEAKGRWSEFVSNVEKAYNIEKGEDGEYVGVDKENPHKVVKLSDLVAKDEALQALTQGRQQKGIGSQQSQGNDTVEGLPFAVSKEMSDSEFSSKLRESLEAKGLNRMSKEYAAEFADGYAKWKAYKK